jgi:hypothetical protein
MTHLLHRALCTAPDMTHPSASRKGHHPAALVTYTMTQPLMPLPLASRDGLVLSYNLLHGPLLIGQSLSKRLGPSPRTK